MTERLGVGVERETSLGAGDRTNTFSCGQVSVKPGGKREFRIEPNWVERAQGGRDEGGFADYAEAT